MMLMRHSANLLVVGLLGTPQYMLAFKLAGGWWGLLGGGGWCSSRAVVGVSDSDSAGVGKG